MSTKQKLCLRTTANSDPSRSRRCSRCSLGPCIYAKPPGKGGGGSPKERKPKRKRKPEVISQPSRPRTREQWSSLLETGYNAEINHSFSLTGPEGQVGSVVDPWVETDLSGFAMVRQMWEDNLPHDRGGQVWDQKFYLDPSESQGGQPCYLTGAYTYPEGAQYEGWTYKHTATFDTTLLASKVLPWLLGEFGTEYGARSAPLSGVFSSVFTSEKMPTYRATALKWMTPRFNSDISLVNFLIELDDLSKIIPTIRSLAKGIDSLGAAADPGRTGKSVKQVLDSVAEGHLMTSFGVLPLYSDLETICSGLNSWNEEYRKLKELLARFVTRRHFSVDIPVDSKLEEALTVIVPTQVWTDIIDIKCVPVNSLWEPFTDAHDHGEHKAKNFAYHVTMDASFICETLGDMDLFMAHMYSKLGLTPNAAIIWNAVPFSFLVDWLHNIGAFLDAHASIELMTAQVNVHNWVDSFKGFPSWKCTAIGIRGGEGQEFLYNIPDFVVRGKVYARLVGEPDPDVIVTLNPSSNTGWSIQRGALSASLAKKLIFR